MVINDTMSSIGSTFSTIRVEGVLIINPHANLHGILLDIRPGGKAIIPDGASVNTGGGFVTVHSGSALQMHNNTTLNTAGGGVLVLSGAELQVHDNVSFLMDEGRLTISSTTQIGSQFNFVNGFISIQSTSASLTIGSGSSLAMAQMAMSMPEPRRTPSFVVRGNLHLLGGTQPISISAHNNQTGGWDGIQFVGSGVEHVQLINVELSKAVNGLEFTNVSAAVVEANGLHISDSFNDGIRLTNSDLLELDYAKVTDSGRHGVWSDGGYVDAFNHIHLMDNGSSGVWMETAGDITGSLNLIIGHGQNGFTTQGMSHLQITGSDIFDIGHKNAFAAGSSTLIVPNNWWGEPNPDPSMFEELAGATLNYSNPSSSPNLPFYHPTTTTRAGMPVSADAAAIDADRQRTGLLGRVRGKLTQSHAWISRFGEHEQGYAWSIVLDALLLDGELIEAERVIQTLASSTHFTGCSL